MNATAQITPHLLAQALDASHEGIAIFDVRQEDLPLIYVNRGFEKLTGYLAAEVIGKSFRAFHTNEDHQAELATIRTALSKKEGCAVTLRSYRKDGSMYWNELSISPVRDDSGLITHFIGIQKDISAKTQLEQQLSTLTNIDPAAGINNRRYFDERFSNLLSIAKRIHSELSILLIDLDYFKQFNRRYGQSVGDECLREVGNCISKFFVRASDCAARFSGREFAVVSFSSNLEGLLQHTQRLCEQVRMLNIPHSDSPHGVVTISIGGIQRLPVPETTAEWLIELAKLKLLAAKRSGCNCVNLTG